MPPKLLVALLVLLTVTFGCGDQGVTNSVDHAEKDVQVPHSGILPKRTSMNKRGLPAKEAGAFRFMAVGHIYGQPGVDHDDERPAPTFAGAVDRLNNLNLDFGVLMGDCFYRWQKKEINHTVGVLKSFEFPLINAPGNHDLGFRKKYVRRFGQTYFAFSYARSRFLILDTEDDPWHISGKQLELLNKELELCRGENPPKNLFIFGHKIVWGGTRESAVCAAGCNDPSGMGVFINRAPELPTFNRDIRPKLREASKKVPIVWFGGDIGAFPQTVHLFHQVDTKKPGTNLVYAAAGIGNLPRDSALIVDVNEEGSYSIAGYEFETGTTINVKSLNSKYWNPKILPNSTLPALFGPYLEK